MSTVITIFTRRTPCVCSPDQATSLAISNIYYEMNDFLFIIYTIITAAYNTELRPFCMEVGSVWFFASAIKLHVHGCQVNYIRTI